MSTIEYTDGTYTETVNGWTLVTYEHSRGQVEGTSPRGQTFTIDRDGDICIEVHKDEVGHGWSGDCASDRYVPVAVITAAIRIWTASKDQS